MSAKQVEVINTQIDTLHEEIAASRSPNGFALLALVASIAVPLVLGVILLFRAERTALHNDEIIRQIARHGLTTDLIDTEKLLDHAQAEYRQKILKFVTPTRRLSRSDKTQSEENEEDS